MRITTDEVLAEGLRQAALIDLLGLGTYLACYPDDVTPDEFLGFLFGCWAANRTPVILPSGTTFNPRTLPDDPDPAVLFYCVSSGTTSDPHLVPVYSVQVTRLIPILKEISGSENPSGLFLLPLHAASTAAFTIATILARGSVQFAPAPADADFALLTPTACKRLTLPTPIAKTLVLGGEAVTPEDFDLARKFADQVVVMYGTTEHGSISYATQEQRDTHPDTVGSLILPAEIRDGVLFAENPKTGEMTSTGDCAVLMDELLYITGREDQMFTVGGVNVHPEEIEQIIESVPGVTSVLVLPVEHTILGHAPSAYYTGTASREDVTRALAGLPTIKQPRDLHHVVALPLTHTAKLSRQPLPPNTQESR